MAAEPSVSRRPLRNVGSAEAPLMSIIGLRARGTRLLIFGGQRWSCQDLRSDWQGAAKDRGLRSGLWAAGHARAAAVSANDVVLSLSFLPFVLSFLVVLVEIGA